MSCSIMKAYALHDSAFLRMKMGEIGKAHLAPYIYESPEEAHQALKNCLYGREQSRK